MLMKEMDEVSNEVAMPVVDLIFRKFPFLMNLPFAFTKKPAYCKYMIDEIMRKVQKMSASVFISPYTIFSVI